MATIPTIPTFTDGDSNLTNLQDLSNAVNFLVNAQVRPTWHLYKTGTSSLSSGITSVVFGTVAFDSDGVSNGTGVTIVTPGYYHTEMCVQVECTATGEQINVWFLVTFGANNPNFTNGTTKIYGARGSTTSSQTGVDAARVSSALCPYALYPGDKINPQIQVGTALTLDNNSNTSYIQGRFVCNFTGRWAGAYSGYVPPAVQTYINGFTVHGYSGDFTAEAGKAYIIDTTSNAVTVQLPSGADADPIDAMVFKNPSGDNDVILVPVSGEHVNNLPNSFITDGLHLSQGGQGVWCYRDTGGWWCN